MTVVVLVLAVLGCSLVQGRIVTKCDLRDQLLDQLKAAGNLTVETESGALTGDSLVAKFVCHAERASGFDTSKVDEPEIKFQVRKRRSIRAVAPSWVRRSSQDNGIGTLYGIFQLGNRVVCSDGTTPSPTICGLDCSELVDDDVHDDIICLLKVFSTLSGHGFSGNSLTLLEKMMGLILQDECRNVQASAYFSKCLKS